MRQSVRSVVTERSPLWDRGDLPFRLDELKVRHESPDGKVLAKSYVSFERGDAVAALIVNRDTGQVILVNQFRASTIGKGTADGRLIETAAGIVRQNETPEQCLQREVEEETGYRIELDMATGQLKDVEFIAGFFPSPGGSSERIYLYYVEVDSGTPRGEGGGQEKEGEFVDTVVMGLDEFFEWLERGDFWDSKTIIAGYWLKNRRRNRAVGWSLITQPGSKREFEITTVKRKKVVGYRCGDIDHVKDVDVWVNSENINFWMDRMYGDTLSARIRTLGARTEESEERKIIADTIQDALIEALGIGAGLELGNVLETGPGSLSGSHNVQIIIHAASVRPDREGSRDGVPRLTTNIDALKRCTTSSLARCDRINAFRLLRRPYKSIIFPLLGAGQGGLSAEEVAEELIPIAVSYLEGNPNSKLERVYFLAYTPNEIEICDRVLSRHPSLKRLP